MIQQSVSGQVKATLLSGTSIREIFSQHSSQSVIAHVMPDVDIAGILRNDSIQGRRLPRYGIEILSNLTEIDGEVLYYGDQTIWKMAIHSREAASLSFRINDLSLPQGSQLFLYNADESMIVGPIDPSNVYNGRINTTTLKGSEVIFEAIIPVEGLDQFHIWIKSVTHGLKKQTLGEREFGDSGGCNVDINCSTVDVSGVLRDAVARVRTAEMSGGSGVLINNTCHDMRSFFLTAYHVYSDNKNTEDWAFDFNYDSPDPNINNGCRGAEPSSWLTLSGANYRSGWENSDFALLELFEPISNLTTIGIAGWNRSNTAPFSTFCIHHPKLDVKKYSRSSTTPTSTNDPSNPNTNNMYWGVTWTIGVTEVGSSGSPLFNPNDQIIGQLRAGTSFCVPSIAGPDIYGKLSTSWVGGNTSTSGLSPWLGVAGTPPMSIVSFRTGQSVTGPNSFCSNSPTNQTFTLQNRIPGRNVTWSVSPVSLFATGGGAATSGTSATAIVRASPNASGLATITFSQPRPSTNCNNTNFVWTKQFWVGKPGGLALSSPYYCTGAPGQIQIPNAGLMALTNVTWSAAGKVSSLNGQGSFATFVAGPGTGSGAITAVATNGCGTGTTITGFGVVACLQNPNSEEHVFAQNSETTLTASPNPARNHVQVSWIQQDQQNSNYPFIYTLKDTYGRTLQSFESADPYGSFELYHLRAGIYYVEVFHNGITSRKSIAVIH
jgi:lysyl endopeptidase